MDAIRHSALLLHRQMSTALRLPAAFFLSLFHPFVWMVLFGSLFQSIATMRGFEGDSYVQFLAPGIAIMSALFGSTYSGLGMLGDIHSGLLDKMLATPVSRSSIIIGPLLSTTVMTVLQAAIIVSTAMVMGAAPRGGLSGILLMFASVALLGSAFAAVSNALAILTRAQRTLISVVNFISLPLVFLSSMMIAPQLMPLWMRRLASINPVEWAVTVSRAAFNGRGGLGVLGYLLLLAMFSVSMWLLAVHSLGRYRKAA